ncbi:MAG: homogentisate 1,2-dioxygenase [Candidatus Melainabacteria bacterium]|nr:homogentisate 1,2-dioxygenase [Candidatus Melainabacteria bacterium]
MLAGATLHFSKGSITRQAHLNLPNGTFEEEHGRDGFYGPVSHLYHTHAPTNWLRIEGPLKPRAFNTQRLTHTAENAKPEVKGDHPLGDGRICLLHNTDVALHVVKHTQVQPFYFRNADGDDVYFVHQGNGKLETDYGPLSYQEGDYVVIPRGTTYRLLPQEESTFFLIESFSRIRQPERGLMGQHALYDPAMIRVPEPDPALTARNGTQPAGEWEVRIKRLNDITRVFYPFNPIDVVGWKGDLTVWQLNIGDICPVMSHRAHLAPSVHTTFLAEGFVVCSFVPRPLETEPGALKVPFYHRNIDYDEVLFYHAGDFFSRDGIDAGMITLHPQGIHHGPHPKALASSWSKSQTDEYAVMVDTLRPLQATDAAQQAEWTDYHLSWREPATV